jgi:hypothetical protein
MESCLTPYLERLSSPLRCQHTLLERTRGAHEAASRSSSGCVTSGLRHNEQLGYERGISLGVRWQSVEGGKDGAHIRRASPSRCEFEDCSVARPYTFKVERRHQKAEVQARSWREVVGIASRCAKCSTFPASLAEPADRP